MIISASRRTDIPAFYSDWFMNRMKAGWCSVANPWNPRQISRISLAPQDVDAIVFWSKNPAALMPRLAELDRFGIPYMFLFTLNDYPGSLEPRLPPAATRVACFGELSQRIGMEKVVWRYDPVVISRDLDSHYHRRVFERIARGLRGHTSRVIVSVVDFYAKTERRMKEVEAETGDCYCREPFHHREFCVLVKDMVSIAKDNGMTIQSCAEDERMASLGVMPGKCIDDGLLGRVFGVDVRRRKDRGQRERCLCVESRDIGATDTCAHACAYCYATACHSRAAAAYASHDPRSPMLAHVSVSRQGR